MYPKIIAEDETSFFAIVDERTIVRSHKLKFAGL